MSPLCIRFCNTVEERPGFQGGKYEIEGEQFLQSGDVVAWASSQPEFKEEISPVSEAGVARLITFREAAFRFLTQVCDARTKHRIDPHEINSYVTKLVPKEIQISKSGFELKPVQKLTLEEGIIEGVLESVLELLTHEDYTRLRICSAESCSWLFWDTSKNGSRKWCDMGDCGNREKARRFREKA